MNKIAVLFSGQGAQAPGMMNDIVASYDSSKTVFDIADEVLDRPITKLTFSGTQEELNLTHNTQPCLLAADYAAYEALRENGIRPDAVAGFSLGEYGALVAGGCITLREAFSIVQKRADYMQEAVPVGEGAMAAIGGKTLDEVQLMCETVDGYVVPANINCPGQIVISGKAESVQMVVNNAIAERVKAMVLPVSAPFHCELLKPAADKLAIVLDNTPFNDSSIPVYMNVDGDYAIGKKDIKDKLLLQAKSPVYWEQTLRNMYRDGVRIFIECGPGKTLSGFVKKTFKGQDDVTILRVSDIDTLNDTVAFFKEKC